MKGQLSLHRKNWKSITNGVLLLCCGGTAAESQAVWVVSNYALQAESFFSNAADESPVLLGETLFETTRFISLSGEIVCFQSAALSYCMLYESTM